LKISLLIKGDNLEVLKHLSNAYYEKVKMIYIDPPYNTGSDGFVYQDDRKFTVEELKNLAGIDEGKAKRILDFTQSKSNSHSAWLTFMYPRLYIAKQLLKEEGVIFASIDDNELSQLRLIMDEIFGEENFIGLLSVENNPKGRKNSDFISVTNDYVLVYGKQKDKAYFVENIPKSLTDLAYDEDSGKYIHSSGKRVLVGESSNNYVEDLKSDKHYSVYYNKNINDLKIVKEYKIDTKDEKLLSKGYIRYISVKDGNFQECTYTINKFIDLFESKALDFKEDKIFEKNFNTEIRIKSLLRNIEYETVINQKKQLFKIDVKTTSAGTYLKDLFNTSKPIFPMSKNIGLVKILSTLFVEKDYIILDFFAGSGTTADSVMRLNTEDNGSRRYILVQLPEPISSKDNKIAYDFIKDNLKAEPTIFEITKERLIRASKIIQKETIKAKITEKENEIQQLNETLDLDNKQEKITQLQTEIENLKNQDLGFKIFETMPIWEDYGFEADELYPQAELFDESKLTNEDIKALLITWKTYDGIALTDNLTEIDLGGYTGYFAKEKLYLMNKGFTTDNLKAILEKIDSDKIFNPTSIVAFGYHFESKHLREISENIKSYANKKHIDIDFVTRY
jgi:adenine-specific DNA-methyltransferase